MAQRIEATEDPERLSAWLDPLLDAGTLAEVERVLEVEPPFSGGHRTPPENGGDR